MDVPFGLFGEAGRTSTSRSRPTINIGIVYVFAIGSLAVYGVILAGWASNNKYSFLGGLRSSAQLISYEIPLGMSILGIVLIAGSLDLNTIINWQDNHVWGIVASAPGFPAVRGLGALPRPTVCRSTCRRPSRSWSAGSTPSTRP